MLTSSGGGLGSVHIVGGLERGGAWEREDRKSVSRVLIAGPYGFFQPPPCLRGTVGMPSHPYPRSKYAAGPVGGTTFTIDSMENERPKHGLAPG